MGDTRLVYSNNLTYLGVNLNKRVSIHNHVNKRVKKCTYLLHRIKSAIGQQWGLSPDKIAWILTAIIRPRLSYGAVSWGHLIDGEMKVVLNRVQRRALVAMSQCMRSSPTKGLEVIFGLPPIDLYITETAIKTWHRIKSLVPAIWDSKGQRNRF